MSGKSSLNSYRWTYISDYRSSGRRRATPAADSIDFPARLLMQDKRSALHIDKAKQWTPAYGLILSFPSKKAATKKTHGLLPGLLWFQDHQTSDVCSALWTGLSQEAASRKVTYRSPLDTEVRHLSSQNFGYVWSHLGMSGHKAQPLTQLLLPIHHLSGCTTRTWPVQRDTALDPPCSHHIGHIQDSHHRRTLCIRGPSPARAHTPPVTAHKGLT